MFLKKRAQLAMALGGLASLLFAAPLGAQWKEWDYELDQEKKPWSELQTQLPSYPRPENLLKLDIGSNTANQYFIDAPSISVGEDGVVRYTMVVKAGGGASNVSFEGIRCDTKQVRIYAFGHPGNQWSRAREQVWRDIKPSEINGYHYALQRDYYCTAAVFRQRSALKVQEIVDALKRGSPRVSTESP
jgi:hypothetical protein